MDLFVVPTIGFRMLYGFVIVRLDRRDLVWINVTTNPTAEWVARQQNGFAERLIGSIRRECLDHVIVLGEAHLRRILRSYARYYNDIRTHRSLNKDARSLARFSGPESSPQIRSLADFIATTSGFRFSVHTETRGYALSSVR